MRNWTQKSDHFLNLLLHINIEHFSQFVNQELSNFVKIHMQEYFIRVFVYVIFLSMKRRRENL